MHGTINTSANRQVAVTGERSLLDVCRQTVNLFPSGKHRKFDSSFSHFWRTLFSKKQKGDHSSFKIFTCARCGCIAQRKSDWLLTNMSWVQIPMCPSGCSLMGKTLKAGYNYVQRLLVRIQPSRLRTLIIEY